MSNLPIADYALLSNCRSVALAPSSGGADMLLLSSLVALSIEEGSTARARLTLQAGEQASFADRCASATGPGTSASSTFLLFSL